MAGLRICVPVGTNDAFNTEMAQWLTEHWYAVAVVLMLVAGLVVIRILARQESQTGWWKFFSMMMGGWPVLIKNWEKDATSQSSRFVVISLIIMLALVIVGKCYS